MSRKSGIRRVPRTSGNPRRRNAAKAGSNAAKTRLECVMYAMEALYVRIEDYGAPEDLVEAFQAWFLELRQLWEDMGAEGFETAATLFEDGDWTLADAMQAGKALA